MKNCYLLILFVLLGCNATFSVLNQGVVGVGDNTGNTAEASVDQEITDNEGARLLTPEEKKAAKEGFEEGKRLAKESGINFQSMLSNGLLHYTAAGKKDWKGWGDSQITFPQFLEKHPKIKEAHDDLQFLLWRLWQVHPTWVATECERSKSRQEKLVKKGVSWTNNSRHLRRPAQACDIVSVRKNGRKDFKDVHAVALYQGIAMAIGQALAEAPCAVFASTVERTADWRTVVDLWHQQINLKPECEKQLL